MILCERDFYGLKRSSDWFVHLLRCAVPVWDGGERVGGPARGVLAEGAGAKVVQPQNHEPVDAEVLPVPRQVWV